MTRGGLCRVLVALASLAACKGHPPTDARAARTGPPAAIPSLARAMTLEVSSAGGRRIHVRVAASGTPADVRGWRLGADVDRIEVLDSTERLLPFRREGQRVETDGAQPTIVVRYDVVLPETPSGAPPAIEEEDPRATRIEVHGFRALGERLLALPEAFETKAVPVQLQQTADDPAVVVASSFGVGRGRITKQLDVPGSVLRRAVFLSGPGGRAELDALEGHDESAWLGYTAFDPRAVSAEVAGFRGLLHEYFGEIELTPATLFFTVDARPRGHVRVLRTHEGVLVALSGQDPYDAPLRLAVAHELVHAWIGERIWVGDASPGHEPASYWFQEGVARWVAREQLMRVGLLSADEYATEVNRLLAIVTTSRHAARPMSELVADRAAGVVPLLVARGALFATLADAHVRDASHGERSFDDVLRALAVRASERRGPLPADAVGVLLAAEISDARARADFDDVVASGRKKQLPGAALGGCFEASEVAYEIYEPGFDVTGSRASHAVVGLEPQGPAAVAGLRSGDVLITADVPDRADLTATVEVEREGKPVKVTYRPRSGARRGQAFRRKPALGEDACRKLALRH